ncbi:MAG: PTS-dependent dihydroxyacetone kinase phosphotransferase subunit DhaM [Lachnospiraceae bacterium]|jgi:dihydroxyacetone kinase phosphotransfer subunit|uniref:dihydroxyacetone kinase phosphoryl donor subunit DhaM n=1 Tax=Roseburia sp. 1XD42-69 TaxID=2320088 RepID=UPI000EA33CDC|nr:dihydroxyacetone kinase phosphoryl donor subunit DhaM [Roseburia sp. 1XD42-69]MCI8876584.1 PTS-dependent dihydroxyacetone kinase phosphotransferase subunit DhaM [Lachnospiraceae bacterium]MCX4319154.1 dihydroxyacetone kinase phosphoryl donor subunit DhaM [Lachnospiraceae bacterium]RKJ63000.1 PTS-dependent dihydroxyacetone kinase phosphotransferase subunit DhaM [Roseburia sp. 1XD42-69]
MVGILIVSHSKKAAEGIYELAVQMAGEDHRVLAVGGMEDGSIGTDAIRIKEGIEKADDGDGVLLLADLGSGILSSQTAIDLLEEDIKVEIADAPILEGAVSAAVQAAVGGTLEEVREAAELAKQISKLD